MSRKLIFTLVVTFLSIIIYFIIRNYLMQRNECLFEKKFILKIHDDGVWYDKALTMDAILY